MGSVAETSELDIPSHCKAGVVVNEGPNFHVEVQQVPVPEPGMLLAAPSSLVSISIKYFPTELDSDSCCRTRRCTASTELHGSLLIRHPYDAGRPGSTTNVDIRRPITWPRRRWGRRQGRR